MEIRFSDSGIERALRKTDSFSLSTAVDKIARNHGVTPSLKWEYEDRVRFTLEGASSFAHDEVIRALLTLDPDAIVRTARACYNGLVDFESQVRNRAAIPTNR